MKLDLLIAFCGTFCVVSVGCENQINRRALTDYSEFIFNPGYEEQRVSRIQQESFPQSIEVVSPVPVKEELPAAHVVYVPQLYPIYLEKKVPYSVKLPPPQAYNVADLIPLQLKLPPESLNPFEIFRTLPVLLETKVPEIQYVPFTRNLPEESPYPGTVLKSVPYIVQKASFFPGDVPPDNSSPVPTPKPVAVQSPHPYGRSIPYQSENSIQHVQTKYPVTEVASTNRSDKEGLQIHVQNLHKYAQLTNLGETAEEESKQQEYVSPKLEEHQVEQTEKDVQKETYKESMRDDNEKINVQTKVILT